MKDAKKKWQLVFLAGLLGVLALSVYFSWTSSKENQTNPNAPSGGTLSPANFKEGILSFEKGLTQYGRKKEIPIAQLDPILHVEKIAGFTPGSPAAARNMFSLQTAPLPSSPPKATAAAGSPSPGGTGQPVALPAGRPAAPASANINLKYIGFKQEGLPKKRQGFFSEGGAVFLAGEGELIANRFRVIKVQDNSAEIEDIPSKAHQQLLLSMQ